MVSELHILDDRPNFPASLNKLIPLPGNHKQWHKELGVINIDNKLTDALWLCYEFTTAKKDDYLAPAGNRGEHKCL
jgi:hypothetical protein